MKKNENAKLFARYTSLNCMTLKTLQYNNMLLFESEFTDLCVFNEILQLEQVKLTYV